MTLGSFPSADDLCWIGRWDRRHSIVSLGSLTLSVGLPRLITAS